MSEEITAKQVETLQGIVGAQWVETDPAQCDCYAFYMNPEILNPEGGRWLPRPVAVVMPREVSEIQELVRYCNTEDIMLKPISTGWGTWAAASNNKVVVLDLKRMDRIIDIDVKNRIAVVEPYVKAINLQTVLWKHGLNVHVVSCGGNHSVLASATAGWGYGLTGSSMGYSGRNLLGAEWVLPSGELLRLGSAGQGGKWFSADGPGPSMRGIMRGFSGTFGAMGVFTKCAVKLYPWDGQAEVRTAGSSPRYILEELPQNVSFHMLYFKDTKDMADAGYKLGEADISYAEFRFPAFMIAMGMSENNLKLKKVWEAGLFQKTAGYCLGIAINAGSKREHKWKLKSLKKVLKETGGVNLPLNREVNEHQIAAMGRSLKKVDDPLKMLRKFPFLQTLLHMLPADKDVARQFQSDLFWILVRHATNTQGTFRPSQGLFTSLGSFDTWDLGIKQSDWIAEKKKPLIEKGVILEDGSDCGCGGTFESGHLGYLEGIGMYNPSNDESVKAVAGLIDSGVDACIDEALGIPIAGFGQVMNNKLGPHCDNYHHWLARLKKTIDPNGAFDPFFYAVPGEEAPAGERAPEKAELPGVIKRPA